ncbi:MAG: type II toxin-antitoxin system HicA family toxin [Acetobacteraceae bacterium]|nr:type II toxin-antitoxin system HicA family toxin [Acetobacteraceae bacterium]
MRRNPAGDGTISDVSLACRQAGLRCDPPRGGGSHHKVSHPQLPQIMTVPFKRPIKAVYIRKLIAMIDAVRSPS